VRPGRAALKGSLGRLELITPERCEKYLRAWTADRQRWYSYLQKSPIHKVQQFSGRERRRYALAALSRPGAPRLTWQSDAQGSPLLMRDPLTSHARHPLEPDTRPGDRREPDTALV
jgi:hypothetical protein